jgi:conjugal transfer pilin signal peptidase TrbI
MENHRLLDAASIFACICAAQLLFTEILIPATHSISPLVLLKTGKMDVARNDYVLFERDDDYLPEGEHHLVKRLGCMPGQKLMRRNLQFFCDDQVIAQAVAQDSNGKKLPLFDFDGVIPTGKAFAVGDTKDSYDSRYWGFIDLDKVERLIVIF